MATVNFKGSPVNLAGKFIQVGQAAPDFVLVRTDLSSLSLKELKGKNVVLDDFSVDFSRFVKSSITFRKSDV